MPSLAHKRGTRAQIDAAATASALKTGEVYLITDEDRLTVGTTVNTHVAVAKQGEDGGGSDLWTWQKLTADVVNSTTTLAAVTGLSFAAAANTSYLVEVFGTFQSALTTTGIALALDIPSGLVTGSVVHHTSTTALVGIEQIADAAVIAAISGVRAANTNVPVIAKFIVAVGSTGGTAQLQFRSEIAASAVTMKAALTAMGRRIT